MRFRAVRARTALAKIRKSCLGPAVPFCSQIQDGFAAASKHILFGLLVCLVDGVKTVGHGISSKQSWCWLPVSKLKKAVALVDFLSVLGFFVSDVFAL